jgi:hypothetical protein
VEATIVPPTQTTWTGESDRDVSAKKNIGEKFPKKARHAKLRDMQGTVPSPHSFLASLMTH